MPRRTKTGVAAAAAINIIDVKGLQKEKKTKTESVCVKRDEWSVDYCTNNTGTQF